MSFREANSSSDGQQTFGIYRTRKFITVFAGGRNWSRRAVFILDSL
jgi:hypothetical protein